MSTNILEKYVEKMKRLRIDRAHGTAPHKPALLLAIIELIEQGQIRENKVSPSPDLFEIFMKYWSIVTDRKPNLALPFFHLKRDGFWHLHANAGYETALNVVTQIKTVPRLREIISHAGFDDDLFVLFTNASDREAIRTTLIDTYFSDFNQEIESLIAEEQQINNYSQRLIQQVDYVFTSEHPAVSDETENHVRIEGFRKAIMRIYDYTCVVCQLHVLTMDGASATEAAHIIPFNESHNNDIRNGISLCRLHHWSFDAGLISVDRNYKVVVSDFMLERGPREWLLTTLRGRLILLPNHNELYPAQEALAWHHEQIFIT
ncbi:MAG: HNH endonuclease [Candidatus Poribacteria bacterium]|nr:HNH endonuclease [Candidatus Poribacteria bacterium]